MSPDPVVSGVPYTVVDVDGRAPVGLEDVDGEVEVTVGGTTGHHIVIGEGTVAGDHARLYEKAGHGGKDVRCWTVTQQDDGTLVAVSD